MANTEVSGEGRIYLQVGYGWMQEPQYKDSVIPAGREVVKGGYFVFKTHIKYVLLAVYATKELTAWDRRVIRRHHAIEAVLLTGETIRFYDFNYDHFLENLRATKLRILERKGLADDGTIFGKVSKTIIVPEKIIPAHEKSIYVDWDCNEHQYETEEDLERRWRD
jgi:hypothetical protein